MKYPSGQSESTSGSASPATRTRLVTGVIRKTRLVTNPHLKVNTNNDNDEDAESKDATPPPLPPRDTPPIPVPPRTYKASFVCEPPLPPRHHLEECEEAKAFARPTEEQSDGQTATAFSQEEHNKECYRIPSVTPPTTVLVPKANSSSLSLDTQAQRDNHEHCQAFAEELQHIRKSLISTLIKLLVRLIL